MADPRKSGFGVGDAIDKDLARELGAFDKSLQAMAKAVRQHGDNELRKAMTDASKEAAKEAIPYIQKYVPEDEGVLKRNIKAGGTRTVPKIKAGTPKKGGPYAWMVHRGHKVKAGGYYKGVPYMRLGIKEAWPKVLLKFIEGQAKAAEIFTKRYRIRQGRR